MRIAIIGSGAMGGYYGAMLARWGADVHFLMRGDYETVRRNGLRVHSCRGDFHLSPVNCYRDPNEIGKTDLVFIGLKTTSNHHYAELISPLMDQDTLAITAQNGLGNDDLLAELFGPGRIAGALAFICSNRPKPGMIEHLDYGYLHIGNYQRPQDEKLRSFADLLTNSGVDCKIVDNLALAQWKKLVWNVPFNGLSALFDMRVDQIISDSSTRAQAKRLMKEIQTAAKANNLLIEDAFLDKMIAATERMKPYYTSMHLDRLNQRPMEIEAIIAEPLHRCRQQGCELPEIAQLYQQLSQLQRSYQNE